MSAHTAPWAWTETTCALPCRCIRSGPLNDRDRVNGVRETLQVLPTCPHHGHILSPEVRAVLLGFHRRAAMYAGGDRERYRAALRLLLDGWYAGWGR